MTEIEGKGSDCGTPPTELTGEAAVTVKMRAYTATGEVSKTPGTVPQGTRVLFTCDVEGLPEGHVAISYNWYHNCSTGRCEIRKGDPYYTAVNDTLLVDTTSWGGMRRRHICEVGAGNDMFALTPTGWCTLQMCRCETFIMFFYSSPFR